MKISDVGKITVETGDEVAITYAKGKKYLGVYTIKDVYASTFSALAEHSQAPIFFPNPSASNLVIDYEVKEDHSVALNVRDSDLPNTIVYTYVFSLGTWLRTTSSS